MGIRTLTSFVRKEGHFSHVILSKVARKLIIDGIALCYALHWDCEIKYSDYYEFYDEIVEFFKRLKSIGIEAYVVIDGIDYTDEKAETISGRCLQHLSLIEETNTKQYVKFDNVLSSFAAVVFVDALRENGIKFFVADGEADGVIASLANHLCCPVLNKRL